MKIFFQRFKYLIIGTLVLTILGISFINYNRAKNIIENKYDKQQELVENSILQTINHVSDAYTIAEKYLNQEMKEYSIVLKDKYRRNPNLETWDLEELKEEFGVYDIYIIDSNFKIIRSTFKEDIGLDFSKYPGFSKLLKKRLEGDAFTVDRLNLSTKTGKIKKYSYMPTHDHQYLLELSIDVKEKFPVLKNLDIFANAVEITKNYDSVEEISFYKFNPNRNTVGELRNTKKPYINTNVSKLERELVKEAFLSDQIQESNLPSSQNEYIAKYIPALIADDSGEARWWNSFVVGIKYSNYNMLEEIKQHRTLFLINILIMVVVFVAFIMIVIYLLKKFEYLAYHDQLTNLPNRDSFSEKVKQLMATADKEGSRLAILFVDVDDFKSVNDNYGHDVGDKVLKETAQRLKDILRKRDAVSRLGGDEFALSISDIDSIQELNKVIKRIFNSFNKSLLVGNNKINISVSIGVSIYPDDGEKLEELIKRADYAMYKAKRQNNDYTFYEGNK